MDKIDLETPEALLKRLLESVRYWENDVTPEDKAEMIRQSRRNYIISEAMIGDDYDEAAWRDAYFSNNTEELKILEEKSEKRKQMAIRWLDSQGY